MIFAFVRWFRLDFLHASGAAKVVNLATNAAALAYFVPSGHVLWGIGLGMATFNILGAMLGCAPCAPARQWLRAGQFRGRCILADTPPGLRYVFLIWQSVSCTKRSLQPCIRYT
jgi:hypothetical protein